MSIAEDRILAGVYQRFPIVAVRGRGVLVWDSEGREYIDCMSGYGVAIVGHCHPKVVEAVKNQCEKLMVCHCSLYNDARTEFLETLVKHTPKGLDRVFLSNSGAESIECAIKLAAKYTGRREFIAFTGSYHGKTLGSLSLTWSLKYRKPFEHLLYPNVKFARYNDVEDFENKITDNTAAVIVEPIQGESGIHVPSHEFIKCLRELTYKHGSLLIVDEVQTGLGRTGRLWGHQHFNVNPDIMCIAKGIGGGIPLGVTVAGSDVMNVFKVGEHSSTFGGNPVACAAGKAVLNVIFEENLIRNAEILGSKLKYMLQKLQSESQIIREVRGIGLMIGVEMKINIYKMLLETIRRGVIPLYSGINTIRLLPPLVINEEQINRVAEVLGEVVKSYSIQPDGGYG